MSIKLGSHVRDVITGIHGTVTARCEYLHAGTTYRVERVNERGERSEDWFDEARIDPANHPAATE